MYLKSLNNFCVKEISNAHLAATLYHSMLDLGDKEEPTTDAAAEQE